MRRDARHKIARATSLAVQALTLDGGSAWAWGPSGWIHAYRRKSGDAIERFQIARNLAPSDPLVFLAAVGIAAAHFEACHYDEAVQWYRRAFVFPSLTIAQIRAGLPHSAGFLDGVCNGLESVGMRIR